MKTLLMITVLFLVPVQSYAAPSDAYYNQQFKSCQRKKMPRTEWRDFLIATHPVITDQCCWDSVEAMRSAGTKRVKDDPCPKGTRKTSLRCPTSKSWCVSVR